MVVPYPIKNSDIIHIYTRT